MRRTLVLTPIALVAIVAVGWGVLASADDAPVRARVDAPVTTPDSEPVAAAARRSVAKVAAPQPFNVIVDANLKPRVANVGGFHDGDEPRPVGRFVDAEGIAGDIVRNEVQLLVNDTKTLDAFVDRWHGTVIDQAPPAEDGSFVALVRVDLARVNAYTLASDLTTLEAGHEGDLRLSHDDVARLLAIVAQDANAHGTVVAPNSLDQMHDIASGSTQEWDGTPIIPDQGWKPNAFDWKLFKHDAPMATGVTRAWQLLDAKQKFANKVRIMVVDGGFVVNPDFPDKVKIRQAAWGDTNRIDCGDHACPWHGSDVTLAAMGAVDNGWGGAGPAGPVGELVAVGVYDDGYKTLRRTLDMVREYDPRIVNMSFSSYSTLAKAGEQNLKDWYFRRITDNGALLFAAAGNDGRDVDARTCGSSDCDEKALIMPCESSYVICVGGLRTSDAAWDDGSNYGTTNDSKSVEIYAPFCTPGKVDHGSYIDPQWATTCGTSFSSPFTAGIAALIMAADPSLDRHEVEDLLFDSAHTGGPIADRVRVGSTRSVNAYEAVRRALGLGVTAPALQIQVPVANKQYQANSWVDMRATATDFLGRPLRITYTGANNTVLGVRNSGETHSGPFAVGTHTIAAAVTDMFGQTTRHGVRFSVVDAPPTVDIVAPANNTERYTDEQFSLTAHTYDPDTYGPIDDADVLWTIRNTLGQTKWTGQGHERTVAASVLGEGDFDVTVAATDDGGTDKATTKIRVIKLAPGESKPTVYILKPTETLDLSSYNGQEQAIELEGHAWDSIDGVVSGTRFRWIAESDEHTKIVICSGSAVPGSGSGGGFAIKKDCRKFTAHLGLDGGPATTWTIRLEVWNAAGFKGNAPERTVKIHFITG